MASKTELTFKINLIAKDLDLKSKDIVDALAQSGVPDKKTTGNLDASEFSILFYKLTMENQIKNMEDYLAGKADIKREPKKVEPKPEKTQEEKKETAETSAAAQPEQKQQTQTPSSEQKPKQEEKKPQTQNKPQIKTSFAHTSERGASKSAERFAHPIQQPAQKKKEENKNNSSDQKQQKNYNVANMRGGGETVTATKKTRVIDTRAGYEDTSKYDYEKLESFVPESARRSKQPEREKFKNKKNPQFDKKKREQDAQLAKLRRAEIEKIKKQPIKITVPDEITVSELAVKLKVNVAKVIKQLMTLGVMANANQTIDFDTACLVAEDMNAVVTKEVVVTIEEKLFDEKRADSEENMVERPPVVCVMGHVDHGKTSLLDAIRNTHVTAGEAGGITQSIGAYTVKVGDKPITFLDTPGHEAFGAMRARGAQATDIAILVVAADDGVMPQTVEAINYAKAAGVSIIVAVNKMDKPNANPDQIKQELMKYDLVPEEWGGDVMCVPVSALKKTGIKELLDDVLLVAELKELKADPTRRAKGVVIEASLKKGLGPTATVLVQNGTLHIGDTVIAGTSVGRVRIMQDENGKNIKEAGPAYPALIVGIDNVPLAGDEFNAVEDEKMARELAEQRRTKEKDAEFASAANVSLDDLFKQIESGVKDLNVIVKADVYGSAEAVKQGIEKLTCDEVNVKVISKGVGGITENDVKLASASNAIIVGFNVRPDKVAMDRAAELKVDVRTYRIIYECLDEIKAAIKGMLNPVFKEVVLGHAQVRQTIRVPSVGTIAGSYVQDGKVTRSSFIRVVRDGIVIFEDKISSLRRFKDDVKEVATGYECGIGLEKFNDIRENDILEAYTNEEVAPL